VRAESTAEEGGDKVLGGLGDDVVVKVVPARLGFLWAHGKGLVDCLGGATGVPRVDGNAATEAAVAVAASELGEIPDLGQQTGTLHDMTDLAQNESTMFLVLAFNPLVGTKSHTFTQTGNNESIADSQKCEVLAESQVLGMKEDDRLVCEGREARVDASDDISDAAGKFVRFGGLKSDLEEDNLRMYKISAMQSRMKVLSHLSLPFGVLVKESFEGRDFVTDTLDLIELVATDEKLHASIALLEDLHPFFDVWFLPGVVLGLVQ
jgi:hypothetical protein